jgi:hypothetical protein
MEPEAGSGVDLLPARGETEPSRYDLYDGGAGCLVFGQFLIGIEAEHGHVYAVVAVNHLGDAPDLDVHCGGEVRDHGVRH